MNEFESVPLDDRPSELRRLAKEIRKEFDRAANNAEHVRGAVCFVIYGKEMPWVKGNVNVFEVGDADEITATLLTYLDEEMGVDFHAAGDVQDLS